MLLRVIRNLECSNDRETRGTLYVDGRLYSNTIEPPSRSNPESHRLTTESSLKRSGSPLSPYETADGLVSMGTPQNDSHPKGCIPKGWYRVRVTYSPKFKRQMPLLYLVPGFEGIRIHAGLSVKNTQGCICVGERWKEDKLTEMLIKTQNKNEEIYIHITDTDDSGLQESESGE